MGWRYVYVVAAVMVFCSINVPPFSSSRGPALLDRRFRVDNDLGARGREWSGIVIEFSVEFRMGGEKRIDA